MIADLQKHDKRYNVISMVTTGAGDKTTEDQPRIWQKYDIYTIVYFLFLLLLNNQKQDRLWNLINIKGKKTPNKTDFSC